MTNSERSSIAAKARTKQVRDRYNTNPNKCKYCQNHILWVCGPLTEVKKKLFCNRSCSASYNNSIHPKREKLKQEIKQPVISKMESTTKEELYLSCKNSFSARSSICKHAKYIYSKCNKPRVCFVCGYSKHIEVCHLLAVKDFTNDSLISKINSPDNLIALCPNHHWEFDNGFLILDSDNGA